MLDQELIDRAAFELLSCSTGPRYCQVSTVLSQLTGLDSKLENESVSEGEIKVWFWERWQAVLLSTERDVPEIELALVLPALARWGQDWVDDLLHTVAMSTSRGAAWLANLARTLHQSRPCDISLEFSVSLITPLVFDTAQAFVSDVSLPAHGSTRFDSDSSADTALAA